MQVVPSDQPSNSSRALAETFESEGITETCRVGCLGWKYYGDPFVIDLPSYIVDTLRGLTGSANAFNVTDILVRLRSNCSATEIALFEYTSFKASEAGWICPSKKSM